MVDEKFVPLFDVMREVSEHSDVTFGLCFVRKDATTGAIFARIDLEEKRLRVCPFEHFLILSNAEAAAKAILEPGNYGKEPADVQEAPADRGSGD